MINQATFKKKKKNRRRTREMDIFEKNKDTDFDGAICSGNI